MTLMIGFIALVVLLVLGVPVLYCFGAVIIFFAMEFGYSAMTLFPTMYGKLASVTLMCIPMFIMAGAIMEKGKIGDALVNFIELFLQKIKGSLSIVMTVACAVFGSICGSGGAPLTCIGSIILPKMRDRKYPMDMMAALCACSAPLGMLIPPSAIQIVVAWSCNLSVLACFLSTVIPGIILTTLLSLTSWVMLKKNPNIITKNVELSAAEANMTFGQRFTKRTYSAIPALMMPVIILGGIYGGIVTPTEAAAVAVIYCIPVAIFCYKGIRTPRELGGVIRNSATSTGVIMVMCVMSMVLGQIFTMENLPNTILELLTGISSNKNVILLMINLFLVFIGMIMDDTCATMLVAPLLIPIAVELGVSPYQMSAIIGVNLGMGNCTPPTAPFLYMSSKLAGANVAKVTKYILIYIACAYVPTLIVTTYIPDLATFLPKLILGSKFG